MMITLPLLLIFEEKREQQDPVETKRHNGFPGKVDHLKHVLQQLNSSSALQNYPRVMTMFSSHSP